MVHRIAIQLCQNYTLPITTVFQVDFIYSKKNTSVHSFLVESYSMPTAFLDI